MLIQWSDVLSVHNTDIDSQHQTLIAKVNELHDYCLQGKGSEKIMEMVSFLEDYAAKHFSFEETYFKSYNFPGTSVHCQMHRAFEQKVAEVKQKLVQEGSQITTVIDVTKFVSDWLMTHIKGADHEYSVYIDSLNTANA